MIRTRYPVKIDIDGKLYSVTVSELDKAQREAFELRQKETVAKYEKRDSVAVNLKREREEYLINEKILKNIKEDEDSTSLLLEQKTLLKKIHKLEDELEVESKDLDSSDAVIIDAMKERFEISVSGDDADLLQGVIEEKGISYSEIFTAIGKEIIKEKEGK